MVALEDRLRSTATVQFILSVRVRASLTFVREKSGANAGAGWRGGDPAVRPPIMNPCRAQGSLTYSMLSFSGLLAQSASPARFMPGAILLGVTASISHTLAGAVLLDRAGHHPGHGRCRRGAQRAARYPARALVQRGGAAGALPLQPADHRGWHLRGPAWMAWAALAPSRKSTTPCRRAGSRAFIAALTAQARSRSARSPRPRRLPAQCSGATAQARFPAVAGSGTHQYRFMMASTVMANASRTFSPSRRRQKIDNTLPSRGQPIHCARWHSPSALTIARSPRPRRLPAQCSGATASAISGCRRILAPTNIGS